MDSFWRLIAGGSAWLFIGAVVSLVAARFVMNRVTKEVNLLRQRTNEMQSKLDKRTVEIRELHEAADCLTAARARIVERRHELEAQAASAAAQARPDAAAVRSIKEQLAQVQTEYKASEAAIVRFQSQLLKHQHELEQREMPYVLKLDRDVSRLVRLVEILANVDPRGRETKETVR